VRWDIRGPYDKLGVECHLYPGAKSDYKSAAQFLKAKLIGSVDKK
jgi:hypothetical protein